MIAFIFIGASPILLFDFLRAEEVLGLVRARSSVGLSFLDCADIL